MRPAEEQRQMAGVIRWAGLALIVGGGLFIVATLMHPSQETPKTILETEKRLVGSHAIYIVSYLLILLGLPALYATRSQAMGKWGLVGFLTTFTGTTLLAISSQFGFIAPVLAAEAPTTLDQIVLYQPVVVFNGVAAVLFMLGYLILGVTMTARTNFPRMAGILIAVGAPLHLIGFGIAQLTSPALWFLAILGSVALGLGLAGCGYAMWRDSP